MRILAYLNLIDKIKVSELVCGCCGASIYITDAHTETFCNFCEAYVGRDALNIVHSSSDREANLLGMYKAATSGDWESGIQYAESLASTNDPFFLYGASNFYRYFSDFVYNDVNYELGGFMYSNADKRSDELQKNKYNAMALISKSKEYLFKTVKILETNSNDADTEQIYLKFISNIKLKRHLEAITALVELNAANKESAEAKYADLVFSIETLTDIKQSSKLPDLNSAYGSANFFYYLAKYLVKSNELEDAIKVLNKLNQKAYMPMAFFFRKRVIEVNSASGF